RLDHSRILVVGVLAPALWIARWVGGVVDHCAPSNCGRWPARRRDAHRRPLTPATWDAFAGLAERHNDVWGGCWCTWFCTVHASWPPPLPARAVRARTRLPGGHVCTARLSLPLA